MSKETFKLFARNHKELATTVLQGKATWQQLYELYENYGENHNIWENYFNKNNITDNIVTGTNTIKDFVDSIKNLDMDSVQQGINNIQKTIGLLQDIGITKTSNETRPIYKRFEE